MSLWDVDWDTREDESQLQPAQQDQSTADMIRDMFDSAEQIRSSTWNPADDMGVDFSWMSSGMRDFSDQPAEAGYNPTDQYAYTPAQQNQSDTWTGQRGPGREVQNVPGGWGASPIQEEERLANSDALAWLRKYQNVTERDMVRRPYYFPNATNTAAATKANSGAASGLGSGYYGGGSRSYGGGGGGGGNRSGYSGGGGSYENKVPSWYIGAANWRFQK